MKKTTKRNKMFEIEFSAPDIYFELSKIEKLKNTKFSQDTCVIRRETQTDYFIQAELEVPINDNKKPFYFDIWVSVSKEDFERYTQTRKDPVEDEAYEGYLANKLPYYSDTRLLKAYVRPSKDGFPWLELFHNMHPLTVHVSYGMFVQDAEEILQLVKDEVKEARARKQKPVSEVQNQHAC